MSREILALRPYQREAIDAVTGAWSSGMRRPAVVLPTGMGKTVVFAHLASEFHARTGKRVVVLVHRDELADQAVAKLRAVAPHLYVGKVKASVNEVNADVVVASVQTLASVRRRVELWNSAAAGIGLVITDECHHGVAPIYQKVYEHSADALHVGFTATLARSDGLGLGSVWDDVVYSKSIRYAVRNGFLVEPTGRSIKVDDLDLKSVKSSGGDYQSGDLGDALSDSSALLRIAEAYAEHGAGRPGVVFTPTVATAEEVAGELERKGIRTAVVSGKTPRHVRLQAYEDFRTGRVQALANCMVLTEGFDAPHASLAIIARPTQSQPLYVQMVGRVLRPFPGKTDALILDVVGASETNRLTTLVDLEEGFWPERTVCGECLEVPCACACKSCGEPRPCGCGGMEPQTIRLRGKGGAIELFAASKSAWLQTHGGVWFLPCGSMGEVFLWQSAPGTEPGTWSVCVAPKDERGRRGGWQATEHRGLTMETAMSWAEAEAEDRGATLVQKSARWRKGEASPAQRDFAARLQIIGAENMTKGDLANAISVAMASSLFDPYLPRTDRALTH